jgi:hypothetical protein
VKNRVKIEMFRKMFLVKICEKVSKKVKICVNFVKMLVVKFKEQ